MKSVKLTHKLPLILAGCACLALAGCNGPGAEGDAQGNNARPPVPVETAPVESRTIPLELQAIGIVQPLASVQIKPKVAGEILEVHFADGAYVEEGDLLFTIDPRPYEAALKRAEANVAIAQAQRSNAQEQVDRYASLTQQGATSREQLDQFKVAAESSLSEVEARQADAEEAALSLEWTRIRSPLTGRAGAALVKAGNLIQANGDVLALIIQTRPIYVSFALPESRLAQVRQWMAKGDLTVTVLDPITQDTLGTGTLTFVDNTVDEATGMINFKATFANEQEALWPGRFVDVNLALDQEPNRIVVPTIAITEGQQGATVFVAKDNAAEVRKIKIDRQVGDMTVILEGLTPGEEVVTSGQLRLTPGAPIDARPAKQEPGLAAHLDGGAQ